MNEREWGRLNPLMIVVRPLNELLGLVPVLFAILVVGDVDLIRLGIAVGTVVLVVLYGLLSWLTTKYRITESRVELHKGVLFRQQLSIPRDRVRTVDLTAKLGHRLFGLSAVRVGTGKQEAKGEGVSLDAVTAAEADRLRQEFLRRAPEAAAAPVEEHQLSILDKAWYRYAPLSLSGLIGVGAVVGFGANLASELDLGLSDSGAARSLSAWVTSSSTAAVALACVVVVLVFSTLASLVGYLLQNHGYRLTRQADGTLRVRRGLLTTRSVSVEEEKLRGVVRHEPLLLRLGGGARLSAVTTGLASESGSALLLPAAHAAEATRVTDEVLGSRVDVTLAKHPRRALSRRLVRAVTPSVLVVLVLAGLSLTASWPTWPWVTGAVVLVPASVLVAFDRYRGLGHGLTPRHLVSRSGSLNRSTVALERAGVIGWKVRQTFFQRRAGLITVTATTAAGAGGYEVIDVGEEQGLALADEAAPGLLRQFLA
ncbi:PH domain-containing protein [Actinokineospora pegani]|uniref:PH domain-containing protein n=1 Tax=Actinokineospora pegani TaxID=2654637 RepID=UPI001F18A1C0|nr:PH domain-containing protein [Actinokineospora pegani]